MLWSNVTGFALRLTPLMGLVFCVSACGGGDDESRVGPGSGSAAGQPPPGSLDLGGSLNGAGGSRGGGASAGGTGSGACGANLTGRVRDFRAKEEEGGHPDFEAFSGRNASVGIVEDRLGA